MKAVCPFCATHFETVSSPDGTVTCVACNKRFNPTLTASAETMSSTAAHEKSQMPPMIPPQIAPQTPLMGTRQFVSPMPRAWLAIAFFALAIVGGIGAHWADSEALRFAERVASNSEVTQQEVTDMVNQEHIITVLNLGSYLIAIVFYLNWVYRAYKNLEPLGSVGKFTPGSAVGWHICPIANLWKPYQIICDLWIGSRKENFPTLTTRETKSVGAWWFVWIANIVFGQYVATKSRAINVSKDVSIEKLREVVDLSQMSNFLGIIVIILTISIIWTISRRQRERRAQVMKAMEMPLPVIVKD